MCTSFLLSLLPTLLGAFAGFLLALLADRIIRYFLTKKRTRKLLAFLREALNDNIAFIEWTQSQFNDPPDDETGKRWAPTYNFDTLPLESTVSLQFELIKDTHLLTSLSATRYELSHLSRQMDLLLASLHHKDVYFSILHTINAHLPCVLKQLKKTLHLIEGK